MQGVPSRIGLRLDQHQRARAHGTPTISVLVGNGTAARAGWEDWLATQARPTARLALLPEEPADRVAQRLAAAILHGRRTTSDVAAFVARHTGEPLAELEVRLGDLGGPERAALLARVARSSGLPEVTRLAGERLTAPDPSLPGITSIESLMTLLQLLPPQTCPGLLLEAPRVEHALPLLLAISERLPQLPVALAVEPAAVDRFLAGPGSTRDQARVRQGLARLDDVTAEPTTPEPTAPEPTIEQLRRELAELCRVAPSSAEAADRARSVAERLLFAALQEHPVTAGRFELNACMPFAFGPRAAEVDLFSAHDRLAVEIDGYHHFVDADAYRRDRRKDALLQRQGLFVLRFLAQDVASALTPIIDRILDIIHRAPPPGASA